MSITSNYSEEDNCLTIKITGRFDFESHRTFRDSYSGLSEDESRRYVVDLKEASYMDSAALGMLLVLREFSGGRGDNITIRYSANDIQKILDVSRFDQLFNIEHG